MVSRASPDMTSSPRGRGFKSSDAFECKFHRAPHHLILTFKSILYSSTSSQVHSALSDSIRMKSLLFKGKYVNNYILFIHAFKNAWSSV